MKWHISESGIQKCLRHVCDSVEYFENHRSPFSRGYNHNTSTGCWVGVKCEMAVTELMQWALQDAKIDENYLNFKAKRGMGDIDVNLHDSTHVLEVKGLQEQHWRRYQRCVTPRSLEGYVKRNSIIIWGTTVPDQNDNVVDLRGWNWAWEIKNYGAYVRTICDNTQLPKDFPLYSMLDLIRTIRGDDTDE